MHSIVSLIYNKPMSFGDKTTDSKGKDCWIIVTAYGKTEYHKPNIMGNIPMYLLSKMSLTKINICKYNTKKL